MTNFCFWDMICRPRSATPHLLVEDGAAYPAAHYKVENFPAVEAGIQHTDTNGYLRILLAFELADEFVGVGHVAGDYFSILALQLGMQLVQVMSQPCGMVLGDGKNDGLARSGLLTGSQLFEVLPGKPVKLLHHLAVGVLVRPFALEFGRIVCIIIDLRTFSKDLGDAGGKFVWHQKTIPKCLQDRKAKSGWPSRH